MTNSIVSDLTIENFKSIKSMSLKPKRINLFIGKPNTGKSNILEALSVFCLPNENKVSSFTRFEKLSHLFYDQNLKNKISVETTDGELQRAVEVRFDDKFKFKYMSKKGNEGIMIGELEYNIDNELQSEGFSEESLRHFLAYKKYEFRKSNNAPAKKDISYLQVPFGQNIFYMLETHPELFEDVAQFFTQYGLDLVLNQENDTMLTQKKIGKRVFQLPYSLVADTLQRMIFYLVAIKTNKNSVLIFEEPETHSFPPYIQRLALEIANSVDNQFFVATHSPYLFNTILEKTPKEDVGIFITEFQDYQTVVYEMTEEEKSDLMNYGMDVFFHLDEFIGERQPQ